MPQLPSGTVTFVFSDIEGSTALLKRLGDAAYTQALATHRRLMRQIFAEHEGQEIDTQGDAFFYSFTRARAAVAAAVAVQRAHAGEAWPQDVTVRIRIGLHTGEPAVGEEGYTGLDVVRASRIAATGRGGQVLLSEATRAIVASHLPDGVEMRSIGEHRLKDIEQPESLSELVIPDVPVTAEPEPSALAPHSGVSSLADLVAPAPGQIPQWLRSTTERLLPASNRLIEERVLAQLEQAFREKSEARERRRGSRKAAVSAAVPAAMSAAVPPTTPPAAPPDGRQPSLADEIGRLQALRDSGALTDEQYGRAVEQSLSRVR
jgi:class 3 adenylate cyclase